MRRRDFLKVAAAAPTLALLPKTLVAEPSEPTKPQHQPDAAVHCVLRMDGRGPIAQLFAEEMVISWRPDGCVYVELLQVIHRDASPIGGSHTLVRPDFLTMDIWEWPWSVTRAQAPQHILRAPRLMYLGKEQARNHYALGGIHYHDMLFRGANLSSQLT